MSHFDRLRAAFVRSRRINRRTLGVSGLAAAGCSLVGLTIAYLLPATEREDNLVVESEDSVARVFARAGLPDEDLLAIMEANQGAAFKLSLVPGDDIRITREDDGRLRQLVIESGNGTATTFAATDGNHFTISRLTSPPSVTVAENEAEEEPGQADAPAPVLVASNSGEIPSPRKPPRPSADPGVRTAASHPGDERDDRTANAARPSDSGADGKLERIRVRNGDSLYRIFSRNRLPQTDLAALVSSGENGKKLQRLRPGQSIAFLRDAEGRIVRFEHELDALVTVRFLREDDRFESSTITRDFVRHVAGKKGVIESSLFAAADGVPDRIVHGFVSVLGWDIDFARDLRRGDSFSILYEELRVDGRRVRTGEVLALEFRSKRHGKSIRALRYTDSDGHTDYYTPEGSSLRRAFMRNPVKFTRISSRFSNSRLHPVLHVRRPHRGVDYAAPRGTEVRTTGDGRIAFAGRKGGYGKTVLVSHSNGHTTLYGHLSRYAKHIRKGVRVKQGEVIGYVGSTGLATGPHLHYEFRIDGVHRDPLTIELPRATPLGKKERERFRKTIAPIMARIDALGTVRLASLDDR